MSIFKGRRFGAPQWSLAALIAVLFLGGMKPALAAGDLLVAPTRIIFERAARSSEITLTNIGDAPATYRISLEFKRMTADGQLIDVTEPSETEKLTQSMIRYAPRKILLAPGQPQQIRLSLRKPENLADGEYRVHMLFRAIPEEGIEQLAAQTGEPQGISIQLRPIYGITIPIFVRHGSIDAKAVINNVSQTSVDGQPMLAVNIGRDGKKSVYGAIKILQAGAKKPVGYVRGVAVYPEVNQRTILVPIDPKTKGKVSVQYVTGGEIDAERVAAEGQIIVN
jgi:P pilus assembly chaperone PapD